MELDPDLVILAEVGGNNGIAAATGFAKKEDIRWNFLDLTSAAFNGRDYTKRRAAAEMVFRVFKLQVMGSAKGEKLGG